MIVMPVDFRAMGWCMTEARTWFEQHGLDFAEFRIRGTPLSQIQATKDPRADDLTVYMADKQRRQEAI